MGRPGGKPGAVAPRLGGWDRVAAYLTIADEERTAARALLHSQRGTTMSSPIMPSSECSLMWQ